ncbi:MAG TPA: CpsD/CapB family tyrosine-protein kinase [Bryobacteraceae bacterium]|jgi:capsular exopolysaccharide synthesis family protein|nr:CpsD/CapB family tyrosine-protein kinase [Bryobacteraceae bacterium]
MSNIFGALRKGGASTPELEQDLISEARDPRLRAARPVFVAQRPLPGTALPNSTREAAGETIKQVSLRISALAPVLPFDQRNQRAAEQYQIVRTKILHHPRKPQFVLISSATSGDGKTVTSINIAASLALKTDALVLLIDGDLRRPSVARTLGISPEPGLNDVLAGKMPLEKAIVRAAELPNLHILPAGECSTRAADLLDSDRWRSLVATVRTRFTSVICDAPPIATVADYELLQLAAEAVILVARPGHSERQACFKALAGVDSKKMLGVVLNCVEDWWLWKTPSYGYYGKRIPQDDR